MGMRRKMFWIEPADEKAITRIREKYGIRNDSDAIRMALRVLAGSPTLSARPPVPKRGTGLKAQKIELRKARADS
jgi:hypothetical protein